LHGGGCAVPGIDQRLGALLTLDQNDRLGSEHARLVVQRPGCGRRHAALFDIPGPKLLLAGLRLIAGDHGDQFAAGVLVLPLGRGHPQLIDCGAGFLGPCLGDVQPGHTQNLLGDFNHSRELGLDVQVAVTGNQVEQIATGAFRPVGPKSCLGAREDHLQAVACGAMDVADVEMIAPDHACGQQVREHTLGVVDQGSSHPLAHLPRIARPLALWRIALFIEIKHSFPPSCFS